MEYDQDGSMSPFWQQTTTAFRRAGHRRRSLPSNLFFNFPFLIILLLASAIFFIFFVIPSVVSFTSQIFRPTSVRKSWDSLNLVLVLFAIICGFLSRTNTDNPITPRDPSNASHGLQRSNSIPRQWYGYSDRGPPQAAAYGRLRSSSSYPDLRQESQWVSTDESWRFFDDTHVNNYRFSDPDYLHRRRRTSEIEVEETTQTKNIPVDTFVMRPPDRPPSPSPPPPLTPPPPPPAATPPPPPPPPSTTIKRNAKRTHQALAHEEKLEHKKSEPPPIAAASSPPHSEEKYVKSDKKRGGATKEFLTSLYQQRKRKKKRKQKSVDNFDDILHQQTPSSVHLYPPPPPPMPPPPSVFQNLFSTKKSKNKKIHSTPPPPPPPPPPPAASTPRVSKTKTQIANPVTTRKPPLPVKSNSFKRVEEYTGNESPLIPMPPPPPPPPFKMPGWKFVVQGDYVRIKSNSSSRSGSPDLDDVSEPSSPAMGGGDSPAPSQPTVFCPPSPDVNTKADNFIARFRAELKLEKVNSIKKQGLSNLGPEPSPRRSPSLGQI